MADIMTALQARRGAPTPEEVSEGKPPMGKPQTIAIPDTLSASVANANKHLVAILEGGMPVPEEAGPEIAAMGSLIQSLAEREQGQQQPGQAPGQAPMQPSPSAAGGAPPGGGGTPPAAPPGRPLGRM